jgi:hypothetical protein
LDHRNPSFTLSLVSALQRDGTHAIIFDAGLIHDLNGLVVSGRPAGVVRRNASAIIEFGRIVAEGRAPQYRWVYRPDPN